MRKADVTVQSRDDVKDTIAAETVMAAIARLAGGQDDGARAMTVMPSAHDPVRVDLGDAQLRYRDRAWFDRAGRCGDRGAAAAG
jgi:hypothetical protein